MEFQCSCGILWQLWASDTLLSEFQPSEEQLDHDCDDLSVYRQYKGIKRIYVDKKGKFRTTKIRTRDNNAGREIPGITDSEDTEQLPKVDAPTSIFTRIIEDCKGEIGTLKLQ